MSIKSLAGQTMWYGVSTILARFVNLLTTPIIGILATSIQGQTGSLYAAIAFINVIFTFGMETTFFRFSRDFDHRKIYNTAFSTILMITLPLAALMIICREGIADVLSVPGQSYLVILATLIICFDAWASMPFAMLRYAQRPRKFAFIKIINVCVYVFFILFFIKICPWLISHGIATTLLTWYTIDDALGYILCSNLFASGLTFLYLIGELRQFKLAIEKTVFNRMLRYTIPMVIIGLGGMVNEAFDRLMLPNLLPGDFNTRNTLSGIYNQNFKLAALIIIFIQAFRMGAEPFFIKQSSEKNAPMVYARIMNFFVILCCIGALAVMLFYDVWKYYIRADIHPERTAGFVIVPILLLSKIFFGIYYNMSVWFKLENKTNIGAAITIIGAIITLVLNYLLIPRIGYIACAWASLACFSFMILASYILGKKYYPVPYNLFKISVYLIVCFSIYYIYAALIPFIPQAALRLGLGVLFMLFFVLFALFYDRDEFSQLPVVGKYLKKSL